MLSFDNLQGRVQFPIGGIVLKPYGTTWLDSMTDGIVRMKEDKRLWGCFRFWKQVQGFFLFPKVERKKTRCLEQNKTVASSLSVNR